MMKIRPVTHHPILVPFILAFVSVFYPFVIAQPKPNFPAYKGHVNDFANVLDSNTKYNLETILTNFEQKSGAQIAVVTMQTLGDQPLEDYTTDLYRAWGIGAKSGANRDKGALLLLVTQDRKTRLEVGYGLESDLPDGLAGEIIRRMRPELQKQPSQYSAGLTIGVRTLVDTLAQKWNIDVTGIDRSYAYQPASQQPDNLISSDKLMFGFLALVIILFLLSKFSGRGGGGGSGRGGGNAWWLAPMIFHQGGGGFGGSSWGSGGNWGGGSGGGGSGGSWGGFGGGSSGGGGASDSW